MVPLAEYHVHDIESTTPYPHRPYWQRFYAKDRIMISQGAIIGFRTGVRLNKHAHSKVYYIEGVLIRRPIKKGWSVKAYYVPLKQLSAPDLEIFDREIRVSPYWATYQAIREKSLEWHTKQNTEPSSDSS